MITTKIDQNPSNLISSFNPTWNYGHARLERRRTHAIEPKLIGEPKNRTKKAHAPTTAWNCAPLARNQNKKLDKFGQNVPLPLVVFCGPRELGAQKPWMESKPVQVQRLHSLPAFVLATTTPAKYGARSFWASNLLCRCPKTLRLSLSRSANEFASNLFYRACIRDIGSVGIFGGSALAPSILIQTLPFSTVT